MARLTEHWVTCEDKPRLLRVAGTAAIDPDCLVAYLENSDKGLWIVEHSGYVCGLGVYAVRVPDRSAGRAALQDGQAESTSTKEKDQ